jgi:hypothetical protein
MAHIMLVRPGSIHSYCSDAPRSHRAACRAQRASPKDNWRACGLSIPSKCGQIVRIYMALRALRRSIGDYLIAGLTPSMLHGVGRLFGPFLGSRRKQPRVRGPRQRGWR